MDLRRRGVTFENSEAPVPSADITLQFLAGRDLVSEPSSADFGLTAEGQGTIPGFAIASTGDPHCSMLQEPQRRFVLPVPACAQTIL